MDKEKSRGMYAHLAKVFYEEWKAKEPKAVGVIQQMKEAKTDYTMSVTYVKKRGIYKVILSMLRYGKYSIENFELNYLDDDMYFDDWYQSVDMNYAITQGILDELEIDFVIDYEEWQACFYEMQDKGYSGGSIMAIEFEKM